MYLAAPPRKKLKVGGGQDEGDAAARASCLPRVMVISLFSLQKKKKKKIVRDHGAFTAREAHRQLGGLVPPGMSVGL